MAVETFELSKAEHSRSGVYPMPLVRATTAGFIGRTERGPVNEPVVVRSFAEFYNHFGGPIEESCVPQCVQDYFMHGGAVAVVVRVTNRATRGEIRCPAGSEALTLAARFPGSHEVLRVSVDYDGVASDEMRFNLVVQRLRRGAATVIADQELFPDVSVRDADDRFIVDALRDSRLVGVAGPVPSVRPDATVPERPGDPIRYIAMSRLGDNGAELTDYDLIGSRSQGTGLFAFDRGPRIDLLCIPPSPRRDAGMTVLVAAERVCAERKSIYIFDPPWSWSSAEQAIAGARSIGSTSRNVATYFPRIRPRGDRARFANGLPACGAVAGLLAHRDARGIWGDSGQLALKTALTVTHELGRAEAELLRRSGVNTFVRGEGGQTLLGGNLTLGSVGRPGRHAYRLDQCRLLGFVLTSIEDAARFALDYFAGDTTLRALERQVDQFLGALNQRGALAGASSAQSYFVRAECGTEPASLRFGVALDRPGEFIEFAVPVVAGAPPVAQLTAGLETERMLY
jgi:hypothetical protein